MLYRPLTLPFQHSIRAVARTGDRRGVLPRALLPWGQRKDNATLQRDLGARRAANNGWVNNIGIRSTVIDTWLGCEVTQVRGELKLKRDPATGARGREDPARHTDSKSVPRQRARAFVEQVRVAVVVA